MNQENKSGFRVVPDTNVVLAERLSKREEGPNKELFERWLEKEFNVLYSKDTRLEYVKKLKKKGVIRERIIELIESLTRLGERVEIEHYHLPPDLLPEDPDDRPFILCAEMVRQPIL